MRYKWRDYLLPSWKILFAIVAILDIFSCWPVLLGGWWRQTPVKLQQQPKLVCNHKQNPQLELVDDEDICSCNSTTTSLLEVVPLMVWDHVGLFFCYLCIVEAFLNARRARQIALENVALDNFERKLADLYQVTRCRVFRQQPSEHHYTDDMLLARNTVRVWTPVMSILSGWFVLLPWICIYYGNYECGESNDQSLATMWISHSLVRLSTTWEYLQSELMAFCWKIVFPFTILQPILIWKRIRLLSRYVRYIRFAGPLLRMLLKLQDQFWVITRTWRQSVSAQTERAKRMARRSMIFNDIRRIESLVDVQTKLTSIPSQLMHIAQEGATDFYSKIQQRHQDAKRLRRRLEAIKQDLSKSSQLFSTSEIYDRVVDLTQELSNTVSTAFWGSNLVSPHTRFSVGWRIVVTCALISELFRLHVSWRLSQSYDIRYTDMTRLLLVECEQKSQPIRRFIGRIFRLGKNAEVALNTCMPTSPSSIFALHVARASEIAIDVICFLDIFVWFFTGELDAQGVVVPKPFFSRCILPGSLTQVLDHPTVPEKLPQLILYTVDAIRAVGYSRVLRWGLAIYPAIDMMVVSPIHSYLFSPMDEKEFIEYTESLHITPTFSSAHFPPRASFRRKSTNFSFSSSEGATLASYKSNANLMGMPLENDDDDSVLSHEKNGRHDRWLSQGCCHGSWEDSCHGMYY